MASSPVTTYTINDKILRRTPRYTPTPCSCLCSQTFPPRLQQLWGSVSKLNVRSRRDYTRHSASHASTTSSYDATSISSTLPEMLAPERQEDSRGHTGRTSKFARPINVVCAHLLALSIILRYPAGSPLWVSATPYTLHEDPRNKGKIGPTSLRSHPV